LGLTFAKKLAMVKRILTLMILITLLMACKQDKKNDSPSPSSQPAVAAYTDITVDQLKEKLAQSTKPVILDVRTPGEVAQGVIEGATVIDITDAAFIDKVNALDKNAPTVVYCKVGGRSATACAAMADLGFKELYNLQGGYDAWKTQQ